MHPSFFCCADPRHDAVVDGNLASVLIGAGAAVAVGGVVLWVWPSSSTTSADVSFDGRVMRLQGTF